MPRVPSPDYTGRDYDSSLERLQNLVVSIWPKWTDFNKPGFGNTILRCIAFMMDVVSFISDSWARESLPTKARLRSSIQSHVKWIGYELSGRSAASLDVTLSLPNGAHGEDITIPTGTIFRVPSATNPIEFQLVSDVVISAGDTTETGRAEHSEFATDIEISTGLPDQVYKMSQSPFVSTTSEFPESMFIEADDGVYGRVENFQTSESTDKHFTVEVDDNERAVVRFGNGVKGKIPEGQIDFVYLVGGGLEGNIEANTLIEIQDDIVDALGVSVDVEVTNPSSASNGDDPESLANAKQEAPASLRVLNRSIAREDYEITARLVPGVLDCLALSADQSSLIREGSLVGYIVAKGDKTRSGKYRPAAPSTSLLESVEDAWKTLRERSMYVRTRAVGDGGGFLFTLDVECAVYLSELSNSSTGEDIFDALDDFFAIADEDGVLEEDNTFGYKLKDASGNPSPLVIWSDVFNVIRDLPGVRKIDPNGLSLNGVVGDAILPYYGLVQLGTVTITNAEDGTAVYP